MDKESEIIYPMAFRSPYGPVTIIPASAMRDNRNLLSGTTVPEVPINAAFYLQPKFQPQTHRSYVRSEFNRPYRRSRTAPARGSSTRRYWSSKHDPYLSDDISVIGDRWQTFSGPLKNPYPLYRKHRYYHRRKTYPFPESELYGNSTAPPPPPPQLGPSAYGRGYYGSAPFNSYQYQYTPRPWWYAPSYTTGYPPSTMHPQRYKTPTYNGRDKYPISWRVILKVAQFIIGAIILGLVLGPSSRHGGFVDFVRVTRTHGQIAVVVFVSIFLAVTLILLLTMYFAVRYPAWRNTDAILSMFASAIYFVVACIESWYAACYPPFGDVHPEACRLVEWAIAAILSFFAMLLYIVDVLFALRTGVSLL